MYGIVLKSSCSPSRGKCFFICQLQLHKMYIKVSHITPREAQIKKCKKCLLLLCNNLCETVGDYFSNNVHNLRLLHTIKWKLSRKIEQKFCHNREYANVCLYGQGFNPFSPGPTNQQIVQCF